VKYFLIILLFIFTDKCPVYPTELVFALDQSSGITERRFNETRDTITSIVSDLNIRENNCPVGARVAVVSYDSDTSYLIRGSDYHNKKHLLQLLSQIKYQVPRKARDIGNAMRFVARNVFKRMSAGTNTRRVAVFFSNGQAASRASILTATMELSALDISLAVFAYNERVFLDEAFGVRISLVFIFFYFVFQDRVSLCSPGCPGTHSVDQAGLELRNPPASASRVLGLKVCATMPG
jgi:hypothetical protein